MRRLVTSIGLLAMVLLLAATAQASLDRVTKAEAQAYFRSGFGPSPAFINPLVNLPEPTHYCVLDWHVVAVASVIGGDDSFTKKDAAAVLGLEEVDFSIDGVAVETRRTPVSRYPGVSPVPEWTVVCFYREGLLLAPGDLEVGQHTLGVQLYESGAQRLARL